MKKDNLQLWNSVEKTNPKHTKNTRLGQMSITAIDPQYQRKNATEKFGAFGLGWGVKNSVFTTQQYNDVTLGCYTGVFWYKMEGELCEFDIQSNVKVAYVSAKGRHIVDDEWMKKCSTDALTKGLSMLGFNSDVFEGKYDDNKYVNKLREEFETQENTEVIETKQKEMKSLKSRDELVKYWKTLNPIQQKALTLLKDKLKLELA